MIKLVEMCRNHLALHIFLIQNSENNAKMLTDIATMAVLKDAILNEDVSAAGLDRDRIVTYSIEYIHNLEPF